MLKAVKKYCLVVVFTFIFCNVFTAAPFSNYSKVSAAPLKNPLTINHLSTKLSAIPSNWINAAKDSLSIAYGHTSHGSQLVDGMGVIRDRISSLYDFNNGGRNGALDLRDCPFSGAYDLGNPDRTAWEAATRNYLNSNPEVNVVMWSWCGQAGYASEEEINTYLTLMSNLETEYPGVKFVYMTGHTDGSGLLGTLHQRNDMIRQYCQNNNKILFDFEDIESYDPDGNYFGDKYVDDGCNYAANGEWPKDRNWAREWQDSHVEGADWFNCNSAHSMPLNANLKGYACWYLWARLAGWDGTPNTPSASPSHTSTNLPSNTPSSSQPVTATPVNSNTAKPTSTITNTPTGIPSQTPAHTGLQTIRIEDTDSVDDSFLYKSQPDSNYGSSGYVSDFDRFAIKFKLPAALTDKHIISAKVSFYVWNQTNWQPNQKMYLYELNKNFDENSVNWNQSSIGTSWSQPGGDFDPNSPVGEILQLQGNENWDHTFYPPVDITQSVVKWASNPSTNFGLILVNDSLTRIGLKASEFIDGARPYLEIQYDDAQPSPTPTPLKPIGRLDVPKSSQNVSGTINVYGWYLDGSGVSKVEVLVDGELVGQAVYGDSRPDVASVYPLYKNNNSGFHYSLNTKNLSNGSHNISIRETGNNGVQNLIPAKTIIVSNTAPTLLPKGCLDSPKAGQSISGTFKVYGWFLDMSGVSKIEVFVDGVLFGQAAYGYSRPDVFNAFPQYQNNNSGFYLNFDTRKLTNGSHTITIRETGNNGLQNSLAAKTVAVSN